MAASRWIALMVVLGGCRGEAVSGSGSISAHKPIEGDPWGHFGLLDLELDVEGEVVTGEARFSTPGVDIDAPEVPCREVSAKVRGTRRPPSLGG